MGATAKRGSECDAGLGGMEASEERGAGQGKGAGEGCNKDAKGDGNGDLEHEGTRGGEGGGWRGVIDREEEHGGGTLSAMVRQWMRENADDSFLKTVQRTRGAYFN